MRQKVKTNLFPKNKTKLFKIMLRQKKKQCRNSHIVHKNS